MAAGEREQKMLESSLDNVHSRLGDVRTTLGSLITKLEADPRLNWHSFLDSQALLSGQLNGLLKAVKADRTPALKKYTTLPLLLSADRDEDLVRITEGRVGAFSHDLVPHYLRTKPEPEVETKYGGYEARVNNLMPENLMKQFNILEKVTREMLKVINRERDEIESKASARNDVDKTHSVEDTMLLLQAVSNGKMLRPIQAAPPMANPSQMGGPMGRGGPPGGQQPQVPKPPSTIKTNIKAAAQVHPYHRS